MRFRPISLFRALLFLSFVQYLFTLPASSQARTPGNAPESFSVSGTIANISEAQLTLSVGRNQTPRGLALVLDSNTQIEGELTAGAQANADYRAEGERLIATHIVVIPASGMRLY